MFSLPTRLACLAAAFSMVWAAAPSIGRAADLEPARIWYSEQFVLHSAITGRDYLIQVAKPDLKVGARAPVVYQMDGNTAFGIVSGIVSPVGSGDQMERAYVVGVGYADVDIAQWAKRRQGDLTPVPISDPAADPAAPSGGADKFYRFLVEELRPRIEARYAIDPLRSVLSGQSYAGLFAAWVLINHPTAFEDYIIGSPSFWADRPLLEAAKSFTAPRPGRAFIGVGADERHRASGYPMVEDAQTLAEALEARSPKLTVKFWMIPDENHGTMEPAFYARALRFVLPPAPKAAAK